MIIPSIKSNISFQQLDILMVLEFGDDARSTGQMSGRRLPAQGRRSESWKRSEWRDGTDRDRARLCAGRPRNNDPRPRFGEPETGDGLLVLEVGRTRLLSPGRLHPELRLIAPAAHICKPGAADMFESEVAKADVLADLSKVAVKAP